MYWGKVEWNKSTSSSCPIWICMTFRRHNVFDIELSCKVSFSILVWQCSFNTGALWISGMHIWFRSQYILFKNSYINILYFPLIYIYIYTYIYIYIYVFWTNFFYQKIQWNMLFLNIIVILHKYCQLRKSMN